MNKTFKQFKDAQVKIVYDRYIEKLNKHTQKMAWDSSAQKQLQHLLNTVPVLFIDYVKRTPFLN